jgi:tetratricopeptide (TPR) repeat protein
MKTHEMQDWLKAGAYYRNRGNFEKALESFAQARLAILSEMGECLASLGQLEEGRVLFEEVLEANSADLRANAGIGVVSLLAGDSATAEVAFGNVLHLDPENAKALCGLAMAKKANGHLDEAYSLLLKSVEKDAGQKSAVQALADVGCRLGKSSEVLPLLRKYLKRHPEDPDIAADIEALEGTAPDAPPKLLQSVPTAELLKNLLGAFRASPDELPIVNELLQLLQQLGRSQEAQGVRTVFLQRNPSMASALLQF